MKYCPMCRAELVTAQIDGATRLNCPATGCGYIHWDNPVPVVAAIVEYNGCVVLARNKAWPSNFYGLITGFLEKDETPEEGVLREVNEELGLQGEVSSFVGHYSFRQKNQLLIAFHVVGRGEIVPGEELADVKLVPPEKLKPRAFGTGPALQDWLRQRKPEKK